MTYKEFTAQLKQKSIHGAFYFEGTEENLKDDALKQLKQALLPEGLEELNCAEMGDPPADEVIAAAETIPFMADQRLVIIRTTGKTEAEERLTDYIIHIPPSAVVIFFQRGKADGRRKLVAQIKKLGGLVSFEPLKDAELTDWVRTRFSEHGKQCPNQAAVRLTFISGSDLNTLEGEISKIVSYLGDRETVAESDVDALATPTVESNVFRMIDDLVDGREAQALERMRSMVVHGESSVGILAMLLRQYRMLQHVKIMQYEHKGQDVMQQQLGVPPFVLRNYIHQAQKYTGGQVKRAVNLCLDSEYRFKAGELRDEDSVLESVMIQLMALRMPQQ